MQNPVLMKNPKPSPIKFCPETFDTLTAAACLSQTEAVRASSQEEAAPASRTAAATTEVTGLCRAEAEKATWETATATATATASQTAAVRLWAARTRLREEKSANERL